MLLTRFKMHSYTYKGGISKLVVMYKFKYIFI